MVCPAVRAIFHSLKLVDYFSQNRWTNHGFTITYATFLHISETIYFDEAGIKKLYHGLPACTKK